MVLSNVFVRFFQQLGLSLGIIGYVQLVSFTPMEITPVGQNSYMVTSTLENSLTEDITELIEGSTRIGIEYTYIAYSENDLLYRYKVVQYIQYHTLSQGYHFEKEGKIITFYELENAITLWCSFSHNMTLENPRLISLEARLVIPDILDEELVDILWHNQNPKVRIDYRNIE